MKNISRKLAGIAFGVVLALGLMGCSGNVEEHEHTFATEWTSDATHHWHAATCEHTDEFDGKAAHDFGEWSEGSRICLICEYECEHTFGEWNEGKRVCSVCDYEQNCGHTWDSGMVKTTPGINTKGLITYTCIECQETKTENIPALGLCESPVDAETCLAATASSTYVYFGVFPKTVLPLDSTVTVDEDDKVEMGANTYFKGSDGEYYAKVLENACSTGDQYKYTDGTQAKEYTENSYRYFKVEPIKWKVLTTTYDIDGEAGSATGALLLAEDILTANVPYYERWGDRTIDGKTVYPNNYKHSQIRAYLNGLTYQGQSGEVAKWNGKGFLQTAFTMAAQSKIVTTTVDNSGASTTDATGAFIKADGSNSKYPTDYTCADTADKVLLLSEKEVTTTAYWAAYIRGISMPTDYAKANCAYQCSNDYDYGYDFGYDFGGYWWLRSPCYEDRYYTFGVSIDGSATFQYVERTNTGVVPALCISLQ